DFCHVQFCAAAHPGHSRLSAGIGELWRRCHSGTSHLGRRLRARLPDPQSAVIGSRDLRYFFFRSRLMRFTTSNAARSNSFDVASLGGSYDDQITSLDFASTRNTMPFARPKLELFAGLASLFTVSPSRAWASGGRLLSGFCDLVC